MPLINHCNGGGGTPQLCGQVENFKVVSLGNNSLKLTWTAPSPDEDNSFVGARIVRKTSSAPTGISDGTVVYEGTALTYTDTGLTAGTTYYYRAFAYNAKKKYQTELRVVSMTATNLKPNFADNTWDEIVDACHNNTALNSWVAGNSKTITIDGVNYQFDIIGKNHDTYTAGGIAPLTFGMHNCYNTEARMDVSERSTSEWNTSEMRQTTLPNILAKMPGVIKNGIRAVNKPVANSAVDSSIITTSDKLFLLSEEEVIGQNIDAVATEGKQYDYYKAGNSKIKKLNGENDWWWLRSPAVEYHGTGRFCRITSDGGASDFGCIYTGGIAFAFCF